MTEKVLFPPGTIVYIHPEREREVLEIKESNKKRTSTGEQCPDLRTPYAIETVRQSSFGNAYRLQEIPKYEWPEEYFVSIVDPDD